jgi:hypothetical protein
MVCSLVHVTLIAEGGVLAVRRPADVHIETDGLHSGGTKLFAFCLFVFIERRGGRRTSDLDDFLEEETRLWWRWRRFD